MFSAPVMTQWSVKEKGLYYRPNTDQFFQKYRPNTDQFFNIFRKYRPLLFLRKCLFPLPPFHMYLKLFFTPKR